MTAETGSIFLSQTFYSGLSLAETWRVLYSDDYDKYYTGICNVGRAETHSSKKYAIPIDASQSSTSNGDKRVIQKRYLRMYPDVGLLKAAISPAKRYYFGESEIYFYTEQTKDLFVDNYEVKAIIDEAEKDFYFQGYHLNFKNTVDLISHLQILGNIWLFPASNEDITKYQGTPEWNAIKAQMAPNHEVKSENFFTMLTQIEITSSFHKVFRIWGAHGILVGIIRRSTADVFLKMINNIFKFSMIHGVDKEESLLQDVEDLPDGDSEGKDQQEEEEEEVIAVDSATKFSDLLGPVVLVPASTFGRLFE